MRPIVLLGVSLLAGCAPESDTRRISNHGGLVAIDIGQAGTTRRICVMRASDRGPCTSEVADLIATDLASPGQMAIRWRPGEQATLDVVMFGGEIDRCRQPSSDTAARMVVRALPLARLPEPEDWILSRVFADAGPMRLVCGDERALPDGTRMGAAPSGRHDA